ncbi:MAG: DUF3107 family protein [Acidimicrobiia bacterium]|nr:DUF3107 family protein [Acidimicrobiia bacterium]MBT8194215.1 DUF3107 family protein [Acidimicrobiia bacterium]NNF87377.1 DUF3107 family protein [Acidimicrobiia bacterium]NNL98185.1 DUF3107 family protein [Acidimicrobiia bacterium]RZV43577.1 MAG: DUF3107 family protein [Acidimicrobiia bacterium]
MRVRIGLADTGTDVDVDIEDADAFVTELQEAIDSDKSLIWVEDPERGRYAIAVGKIAYVHIEGEQTRSVGLR